MTLAPFHTMKKALAALLVLIVASCGDPPRPTIGANPVDTLAAVAIPSDTVVDLAAFDLPLKLTAPDAEAALGVPLTIRVNDERGWVEVDRGEHFRLCISEVDGDELARLKADLQRDQLRKATVITERPDLLLYKQEFPADPSLVFVHFLRKVNVGGRQFTVESAPDGRFNEADAWRMIASIAAGAPS